jgi:hypothetical protein
MVSLSWRRHPITTRGLRANASPSESSAVVQAKIFDLEQLWCLYESNDLVRHELLRLRILNRVASIGNRGRQRAHQGIGSLISLEQRRLVDVLRDKFVATGMQNQDRFLESAPMLIHLFIFQVRREVVVISAAKPC